MEEQTNYSKQSEEMKKRSREKETEKYCLEHLMQSWRATLEGVHRGIRHALDDPRRELYPSQDGAGRRLDSL
jgi:hypothetical protein